MEGFLEQEVLGFNHAKGVYSIVHTYHPFSFFVFAEHGLHMASEARGRGNDSSEP